MKRNSPQREATPGGQLEDARELPVASETAQEYRSLALEQVLQALPYAVFSIDAEGCLALHNAALERLLGFTEDQIMPGAVPRDFLQGPILATVQSLLARTNHGSGGQRVEVDYESPLSGSMVLDIHAVPMGESPDAPDCTLFSITELSATSGQARANQLDEAKTNFLSLVSHELRTPLTAMKGSVHLLREAGEKYGFEKSKELVRVLEKNTERMVRLVGNLLDLVHLQNDSMTINRQRHNLREIADAALAQCADDAAARRITVETGLVDLYAPVDRDRIAQALGNVLLNAIRFSKEDSVVRVSIERHGEMGRLRVSDTTEGLAARARRRQFASGQAGSLVEACTVDGSGIGMVVSRSLVELHGGSLYAEERAGSSGVDFVIELPVATPWDDA